MPCCTQLFTLFLSDFFCPSLEGYSTDASYLPRLLSGYDGIPRYNGSFEPRHGTKSLVYYCLPSTAAYTLLHNNNDCFSDMAHAGMMTSLETALRQVGKVRRSCLRTNLGQAGSCAQVWTDKPGTGGLACLIRDRQTLL